MESTKSTMRRYVMVTGLATIALGTTVAPSTAAETALSEQNVRTLLNTAVSYHYHAEVRRKTTEGACYFDPDKPTTLRCSWRWNNPGADAFRLRQKVKQDAVKWCKKAGGKSCIELYRNGRLRYDGLSLDETQRLEAVLGSIPSYDPEATPLPDNATVRAGLFHERFAQMQGYWEDWRKKKSKRNYAMCANAQGSGVRFQMQGEVKQLPHVRKMCILQCQAVAQWENTQGACHTIFENGEFTNAAAQRAMTLEVKPAPVETRNAFVGAWNGINHRGSTMETVVERVDADGGVAGTGCSAQPNGTLSWRTLDNATFENGDRISIMTGQIRTTLMMSATHEGAAEMVQTWPSGWQSRIPLQPMRTRGCNERFTAGATTTGSTLERRPDDPPIVGTWSGKWKTGMVSELSIEAVADDGALTGRTCTRTTEGSLKVWDIGSGGPFEATVGKKGKKALMTVPWGDGKRDELEFRIKGNDKMTLKLTKQAGTRKQTVETLKMTRGASEDGCLLRTTSLTAANES